ncbi:hypothetical protein AVDCRST_MAG81-4528 [uncultured Synechococcales cyanobacterium]|uniref:Uncharacterized protein n=1 Tax=uncultured Synechococcales cyanobacterium TaxID=1936017 RepID=A0A6J4VUI4_9CYAN|nr:hypothetical protein AVDCRST_MAG81-4528 [uncultured Synechococcales cyanobacterium]
MIWVHRKLDQRFHKYTNFANDCLILSSKAQVRKKYGSVAKTGSVAKIRKGTKLAGRSTVLRVLLQKLTEKQNF